MNLNNLTNNLSVIDEPVVFFKKDKEDTSIIEFAHGLEVKLSNKKLDEKEKITLLKEVFDNQAACFQEGGSNISNEVKTTILPYVLNFINLINHETNKVVNIKKLIKVEKIDYTNLDKIIKSIESGKLDYLIDHSKDKNQPDFFIGFSVSVVLRKGYTEEAYDKETKNIDIEAVAGIFIPFYVSVITLSGSERIPMDLIDRL